MAYDNTLTYGSAGATFGPWGAVAGAGLGLAFDIMGDNAQKKAAAAKAAALKKRADFRLQQGKQEADIAIAQGGANQTSQFTQLLSNGASRNSTAVNSSLNEIANRAEFTANQAIAQAQADAEALMSDASDTMANSRSQSQANQMGMLGSILGTGAKYYEAKNGKY